VTRTAVWKKGDWEVRGYTCRGKQLMAEGYRFRYELDGLLICEFTGVPDYREGVFRMRGIIIHRYQNIPEQRVLYFGDENKEKVVEIKTGG
jgi:hypothetical protein